MNEQEFWDAVFEGDIQKVSDALGSEPSLVHKTQEDGTTPLHVAASGGGMEHPSLDLVKLLLENGADITCRDQRGYTPLHEAESREVAQAIVAKASWLRRRSVINRRSDRGATPLHVAATQNRKELVEFLVRKGANVNARTRKGTSPLRWAAVEGNSAIVKFLQEHGASEDISDIS
jgi:ankyrin repeat protein